MPIMRYTLSFDDYCHSKKTLARGRRFTPPRRPPNGKIELQHEVGVNEYAYFQAQLKRRRQLGEPCTMSDLMTDMIRSGLWDEFARDDWEERIACLEKEGLLRRLPHDNTRKGKS